jgi:hypothetical protein
MKSLYITARPATAILIARNFIIAVAVFTASLAISASANAAEWHFMSKTDKMVLRNIIFSQLSEKSRKVQPAAAPRRIPNLVVNVSGPSPYVCSASGFGQMGTCVRKSGY